MMSILHEINLVVRGGDTIEDPIVNVSLQQSLHIYLGDLDFRSISGITSQTSS